MDSHHFGWNNSSSPSRALRQNQRNGVSKHARIAARDLVSFHALGSVTDPAGTLGEPAVTDDALKGELFGPWDRHRRLTTVWEQLDILDDSLNLNNVVELPQRARNLARRQFTSAFPGLFRVPHSFACDHFGVATSTEALYIEGMKFSKVELDGDAENLI